jgi:putative peptidoglycan lipid II flippase
LRDFLAEGASNAAFVPVFSEYAARRSKEEFWELAQVVLVLLAIILAAVTLLGVLLAPVIVPLIAPGFVASAEKMATTVSLTRILFPYIFLVSLAAYAMGLLNSLKHFAIPALAPCFLNLSMIVFTLIFGESTVGLACGVLIGGFLQLAVQIPVLYRKGFRFRLPLAKLNHPAARAIGRLMIPRIMSSGIYQLNNFVDTIFGSLSFIVGDGGVVVLYLSYRLIQFPLGIFSTALSQAVLPTLSTQVAQEETHKMAYTLSWALRSTFFVLIPVSLGFMVLAQPMVQLIFGGGKFDAQAAAATATALVFYSAGLCAYGGSRIVQACFFAMKDTRTPAKIAALALVINIILNALLIYPLKTGGIALATSLSGIVTFCVLVHIVQKRIAGFDRALIISSFMRILCAALGMSAVCYAAYHYVPLPGATKISLLLKLVVAVAAGILSYAMLCGVFRVHEMRQFGDWIRRRPAAIR